MKLICYQYKSSESLADGKARYCKKCESNVNLECFHCDFCNKCV